MRKAALRTIVSAILLLAVSTVAGAAGFHKVSEHFYYLESKTGGANTSAIVTQEGVVLIDPPQELEMPAMLNALKAVTSHPVRWVISTDYQQERSGGTATLLKLARQSSAARNWTGWPHSLPLKTRHRSPRFHRRCPILGSCSLSCFTFSLRASRFAFWRLKPKPALQGMSSSFFHPKRFSKWAIL